MCSYTTAVSPMHELSGYSKKFAINESNRHISGFIISLAISVTVGQRTGILSLRFRRTSWFAQVRWLSLAQKSLELDSVLAGASTCSQSSERFTKQCKKDWAYVEQLRERWVKRKVSLLKNDPYDSTTDILFSINLNQVGPKTAGGTTAELQEYDQRVLED